MRGRPLLSARPVVGLWRVLASASALCTFAVPRVGSAQVPDFTSLMSTLHSNALGMIRGCDYERYLKLADQLASVSQSFKSIDGGGPGTRWAVPFLDPISMIFRAAGSLATKQTAQAEHQGLAMQLEQVCNAVMQADEVARQRQLLQIATRNIGVAINWLMRDLSTPSGTVPGADAPHVNAQWATWYTRAAPTTGSPHDTVWAAVDGTLQSTLAASTAAHGAIDSIAARATQLEGELLLLADPDSTHAGQWTCPTGYPDPNRDDVTFYQGQRVCGPATPERAAQVTAHLEVLKTELAGLRTSIEGRNAEVASVQLLTESEGRRVTEFNRAVSVLSF